MRPQRRDKKGSSGEENSITEILALENFHNRGIYNPVTSLIMI